MLNGREALKRELQTMSIVTSGFGTYNHSHLDSPLPSPRKRTGSEVDGIRIPQRVWMDTIKEGRPTDAIGVAQIHVDQRIVVSNM